METATFPQQGGEILIPLGSAPTHSTPASSHQHTREHSHNLSVRYDVSGASSRTGSSHSDQQQGRSPMSLVPAPSVHKTSPQRKNKQQQLQIITDLKRGAPGDPNLTKIAQRNPAEARSAKQKSQFYGEMFAYREPAGNPRERASRDSVITAEVKTNVIIRDEYSFLTSLSAFLAQRYARPESSIAITLVHSTCVLLGGSFDPAYILTITALPDLVSPTINKRNAALLATHMYEELAVPADRGVMRFTPLLESCLAIGGSTILAVTETAAAEAKRSGSRRVDSRANGASARSEAQPSPWRTAVFGGGGGSGGQSPPSARTNGDGNGMTPGNLVGSAAGAATGAIAGVAGNLFGRKKESRRDLRDNEKRSLLKGKGRERPEEADGVEDASGIAGQNRRQRSTREGELDHDLEPPPRIQADGGGGGGSRSQRGSISSAFHRRRTSADSGRHKKSSKAPSNVSSGNADADEEHMIAQARTLIPSREPRTSADEQAERMQTMGKRRSFLQMFGR